jgi:two-component system, cell cycle response regulator
LDGIKGTSGTIQLGGLQQIASKLMDSMDEENNKLWATDELRDYLYELIGLTYEYEHFLEVEEKREVPRSDDIPLIQIIDDDVSMLILLKGALEEKGWMVIANSEPKKAIKQYFEFNPDCLILDLNLRGKSGFQLIENLQEHNQKQFVPKIMISMLNDRQTRIDAYKSGADDFIEKPIDLEEFIVRVERHLQRKKLYDKTVMMDELTKVYNRKFLNDELNRNMNDLQRTGQGFAVAMIDLDYFKRINDNYGHLIGDRVLADFAKFLKEDTRSSDMVFRYGGEEFIIIFPKTSDNEACDILSRLLTDISNKTFDEAGKEFTITFSAGIFHVNSHDISIQEALKAAEQALFKAKEKGRARVECASQETRQVGKRILKVSVIDDDAIIRTMLMKVMKSMKFNEVELEIKLFEDGQKFFDSNRLVESGEHFLILDGVMPVMDGLEVLQKVKKSIHQKQLYVLMLTGRKSEDDVARALKLGADDYVTKPFSITELHARIQRLIQRME